MYACMHPLPLHPTCMPVSFLCIRREADPLFTTWNNKRRFWGFPTLEIRYQTGVQTPVNPLGNDSGHAPGAGAYMYD